VSAEEKAKKQSEELLKDGEKAVDEAVPEKKPAKSG